MILKDLVDRLDSLFLKSRAMAWDNVGLLLGDLEKDVKNIHVSLDIGKNTLSEAEENRTDLIISHHPLIFAPLKKITSGDSKGKLVLNLLQKGIAVYAAHSNYDIDPHGLNGFFARRLNLKDIAPIQPFSERWYKFVIFVPPEAEEKVRQAICSEGGGKWRNYSCCTFNTKGVGTFFPIEGSKPYSGEVGKLSFADEVRVECIVSESILDSVVKKSVEAHPYEEAAYDVYPLENRFEDGGIGITGSLEAKMGLDEFLKTAASALGINNFRWTGKRKEIKKIAVVCGSANSLYERLARVDCELIMVGELSYHNCHELAESGKIIVEMGHGDSERCAIDGMHSRLSGYFKKENIDISLTKSKRGYCLWRYHIG